MVVQKVLIWCKNNLVILLLSFLFLAIVFINAWLADDAYITFRTVDNFVNGYGLTWNISERVQSFTHPLWTFIISGFYFLTREIYFTSLIISLLISLTAVLLIIFKLSDSVNNSILVVLILVFSRSFIDYSTSGLDNPLTHLILVIYFIIYFKFENSSKKLLYLSFVASLAALNRLDIMLICFPILVTTYLNTKKLKGLFVAIAGFLPVIIWEAFSLVYYGFLFPNTAYAKLNTGVEYSQLITQGLHYLLFSVYFDPITPILLLAGLITPFLIKDRILFPLSAGIFLYLIYTVNVGGDFMGGRFLSAPLLCSVIIISKIKIKSTKGLIIQISTIVIIGLLSPKPTFISTSNDGLINRILKTLKFSPYSTRSYHGIVDERMHYYAATGLLRNINENQIFKFNIIDSTLTGSVPDNSVVVEKFIGVSGYYIGPKVHIIDPLALSDPLLSKLPCRATQPFDDLNILDLKRWRIGHFERELPDGYFETISSGINLIRDPNLREYYDKLSILIKGDIWDINRLKEIWHFNTGKYEFLVKNYIQNQKMPSANQPD